MSFATRGGRKAIVSDAVQELPAPSRTDNALLKALARAHRWRERIENGEYSSITGLANAENINESYACRLLRLTLLAPPIVKAILDGRHGLMLKELTKPLPIIWTKQCEALEVRDK
jgi:hypothetical protein